MNEAQMIGYAVLAIITLGSFIAIVSKYTQPINDLKIVIQELKDCVHNLKEMNTTINGRLDVHGHRLDDIEKKLMTLETRMNMYHKGV